LDEFNTINPKLEFTIEEQPDYTINFLDLPTATDTIIYNALCHPNEHKRTGIKYLNNRVNTYKHKNKNQEEDVIEAILRNNGYCINNSQRDKKPKPSTNMTVPNNGKKYITFT
jgi:hypothetical protein